MANQNNESVYSVDRCSSHKFLTLFQDGERFELNLKGSLERFNLQLVWVAREDGSGSRFMYLGRETDKYGWRYYKGYYDAISFDGWISPCDNRVDFLGEGENGPAVAIMDGPSVGQMYTSLCWPRNNEHPFSFSVADNSSGVPLSSRIYIQALEKSDAYGWVTAMVRIKNTQSDSRAILNYQYFNRAGSLVLLG
jgi:hypothetical protein